jgi:hypothetical protein
MRARRTLLLISLPVILLIIWTVFISFMNWEYEAKFFRPALIQGQLDTSLGPKLFVIGVASGFASSLFIFLAFRHAAGISRWKWIYVAAAVLVAVVFLIMASAIMVLGPAAITMKEQLTFVR